MVRRNSFVFSDSSLRPPTDPKFSDASLRPFFLLTMISSTKCSPTIHLPLGWTLTPSPSGTKLKGIGGERWHGCYPKKREAVVMGLKAPNASFKKKKRASHLEAHQ